jgi:hypothetical protein
VDRSHGDANAELPPGKPAHRRPKKPNPRTLSSRIRALTAVTTIRETVVLERGVLARVGTPVGQPRNLVSLLIKAVTQPEIRDHATMTVTVGRAGAVGASVTADAEVIAPGAKVAAAVGANQNFARTTSSSR